MKKISSLLLIMTLVGACSRNKVGYINTQIVFNDFTYKKELEKELLDVTNRRKFIVDSLEANLKILIKKINLDKTNKNLLAEYQAMKEIFLEKKSVFSEEEELMVKHYDEKILSQLNSYVMEYGKLEKYDIIYGANSTGNIMYADTSFDLTKKVTQYINEKFKGKH